MKKNRSQRFGIESHDKPIEIIELKNDQEVRQCSRQLVTELMQKKDSHNDLVDKMKDIIKNEKSPK